MMRETASFSYWTGAKPIIRLTYAKEKHRGIDDLPVRLHIHPAHELILVKRGRMRIQVKDRTIDLLPGHLLAIPYSNRHSVRILEEDSCFINIMFRGTLFPQLQPGPVKLAADEIRTAEQVECNMTPPFDFYRAELAVALLAAMLCSVAHRIEVENPSMVKISPNMKLHVSRLVLDVLDFLEEHYQQPVSLEKAARHVNISSSYLRHLLQKETGVGFSAHLHQIRINHAKQMIANSPENIKTIAYQCGFNSMGFFYKTFKRFTGFTPLEYGKSLS